MNRFNTTIITTGMVLVCAVAILYPELAAAATNAAAKKPETILQAVIDFFTGRVGVLLLAASLAFFIIQVIIRKQVDFEKGVYICGGGMALGSVVWLAESLMGV